MGWKRRLARRVPGLSRGAASLDWFENTNRQLQHALGEVLRTHSTESDATAEDGGLAPDGMPMAPAALRYWVAGSTDPGQFLELGRRAAEAIEQGLARRGVVLADVGPILDFGCGCGRVIRHLARQELDLHGSDFNRTAIAWCDAHLRFAEFGTNELQPPTRYRSGAFGLVYALSVFTHLTEALQRPWMEEMRRIVRPRGYLILSLHGADCLAQLSDADRGRFHRGELVVCNSEYAGQNSCGAYHPEAYVRGGFTAGFEVLEFVPRGALGNPPQDLYLLRRSE